MPFFKRYDRTKIITEFIEDDFNHTFQSNITVACTA